MSSDARARYVAAVRGLAAVAQALQANGADVESVARALVAKRNALKAEFRASDPPAVVSLMEARNRAKYGHPLGPGPEWFLARYGSWDRVIEAACRPADLSGSAGSFMG